MNHEELRNKNRETVKRFFELHGTERAALFAEDGAKEIPFPAAFGQSWRWEGRDAVLLNLSSNKGLFTNWRWSGLTVDDTQDPNKFWVETIGRGEQRLENGEPRAYENHYIFHFTMREGFIVRMREFHNPLQLLHSMGVELPKVPAPAGAENSQK